MCNFLLFIRVVPDRGSEYFEVKNLLNESIHIEFLTRKYSKLH